MNDVSPTPSPADKNKIHVNDLQSLTPPVLDPDDWDAVSASLREQGYAVVKVMHEETATERFNEFWDWLEALGSGIDRRDPKTWDKRENWPDSIFGMLSTYGIGQADFVWKCRTNPAVMFVFSKIWNVPSSDLLTSFDGACLYPSPNDPVTTSPSSTSTPIPEIQGSNVLVDDMIKLWPHRDQAPNLQTFACVQGQLNLRSNLHPTDGGLVLYPGTHTIDWGARYPKSTNYSNHYYSPPYDEAETSPSNARVIRSPAGSLIIWDSRLIHCNRPPSPQSGSTRAVVYICMMPRSLATEATLKERIELHKKHCTTGHWPHELVVNGDGGFLSGSKVSGKEVMKVVRRREVYGVRDPVVRRLVGYDSGEPTVMEAVGNVVAGAVGWFKT